MKISGEAQAVLLQVALVGVALGVGYYFVSRGAKRIGDAVDSVVRVGGDVAGGLLGPAGALLDVIQGKPVPEQYSNGQRALENVDPMGNYLGF